MIRRTVEDIALAMTFTTLFPYPNNWIRTDRRLAEAIWAIPLIGGVIGSLGGGLMIVLSEIGFDPALCGVFAIAAMTLTTGALHEDGLADFCDGIGGGCSVEHRLKIMHDSQIGTYGTLALILSFALLLSLIEELWYSLDAWHFLLVLISAKAISRSSSVLLFIFLLPARDDGLAVFFGRPGRVNLILTMIWPLCVAFTILGLKAAALTCGALTMTLIVALIAYKYLGGYTGDVLGASIYLSLIASLTALKIVI
ncbi:MAG: adenosylcobinamide-GDP ribazoletransferase [Hyphomicrobiaceae bacterium]|nr:adenosylcobinamide-GDP ribazoletransferase [Hyphomicrobiaceae bacterium]